MKYLSAYSTTMLAVLLVCVSKYTDAYELYGSSFYAARSQSVNLARHLVGYCQFENFANKGFETALFVTPEYSQSFRSPRVAEYYYNSNVIALSGSKVAHRNQFDFLADNFGLPQNYEGTVRMDPVIYNALAEFDLYLCYRNWFFHMFAPVAWTKWNYAMCECATTSNEQFPAGYMAAQAVRPAVNSYIGAMRGYISYGDVVTGMTEGLINGPRSAHGLADLRFLLGYHIRRDERAYLGLSLVCAAPTGTTARSAYFFEPVIGNGHHWELGVGFDGRALAWEAAGEHTLSFYGSIRATTMFKNHQYRSFDFCKNGFASRFLLLKEFNDAGVYAGRLVPAINVTTLPCSVWSVAQFDIALMLGYLSRGLEIDFGYNAWIRTEEHVRIKGEIPAHRYGIKGVQNVTTSTGAPDNKTQSCATIYGNNYDDRDLLADQSPVFISINDLNVCSGAARSAFTQKFFGNVGYTWHKYCYIDPYMSIGGEVEFEGLAPVRRRQANNNSVAQWGVWLKGGMFY